MKWPLNSQNISGVLMPALAYRFRILFEINNKDERDLLTKQIISCENNYKKRETKITIRGPYNSCIHTIILKMCKRIIDIQIQELDGSNAIILNTVCFLDCILKNHKVKYNYGKSEAVNHTLTFKAAKIKVKHIEGDLYFEDVLVLE